VDEWRFDAQDLGECGVPDLELLVGRLARPEQALQLVSGQPQGARGARAGMAL
jgi:hypothetical protein